MRGKLKETSDALSTAVKQQTFQLKISDALWPLGNPVDIEEVATKIVMDFMDADRCFYSTIEEDNVIILRDAVRGDMPSVAGVHPISSFPLYRAVLSAGHPFVVDDVRTNNVLDEDLKKLCLQSQYGSFINVPVIKNNKAVGLFSLVQAKSRKWTDAEVQLTIETAERTWAAVERAKAEEALRKSEEKYRSLFNFIDKAVSTIDIIFDENQKAIDFLFIENNAAFTKLTGLPENIIGRKWLEFVSVINPHVADIFERVIKTGEPVRTENHVEDLDRWHDIFFTLSGEVGSNRIICVYSDITDRKNEQEKQTYNLKLSDAIKDLIDPVEIQLTACRILGEHAKVNRVLYGEVIDEEQIIINNNYVNGVLPIIATLDAEQYGRNVIDAFKRNEKVIISDITTDPEYSEEAKQSFLSVDVVANAGMGLVKGGRWVATFGMHTNAPRKWTATEIWLLEETAERTWAAVERAKAEQALRQSEEKYRTLFTSIDQGFVLCELVRNKEGKGIDYYMLEVNPTYEKQTGLSIEMVLGKTVLQAFPTFDMWWIDTFAAVVDNQRPVVFEKYFENTYRWHEIKAYPGEKDKFSVLFSDITERKQAEENIKESESRFRTMADASPVLIWTLDENGSSSYYNKTFLDFIGVTEEEDISDWRKIVHPDDVEFTFSTINTVIAERRSYSLELRLLRADGQWRWVLAQGNPSMGADNEFLGFVGSSVDITEQKQAEEKIKESEKRFSNLLMESNFAFAILKGKDMVVSLANDAIKRVWGKGSDIEGKSLMSVMPEIEEQGFAALLQQVYTTGKPFYGHEELVKLQRNGIWEEVYFNFIYQPYKEADETISGVTIIANEVTTQAIANKKIAASQQNVSRLFMEAPAVICVLRGPQHVYELANEMYLQLIGNRDILGKPIQKAFPELEGQGFYELLDNVYVTGEPFIGDEMPVKFDNGAGSPEERYINFVYQPTHNSEGEIDGILVHGVDVTEQVETRKKIEESEHRFHQMIYSSPSMIAILRGEDLIIEVANDAILEQLGKGKNIIGLPFSKAVPEMEEQGFGELLRQVYKTGIPHYAHEMPGTLLHNGIEITNYYNFIYQAQRNIDNEIVGIAIIATTVTPQAEFNLRIKESEQRFKNLVRDAATAIIVYTGDDMKVEIVNKAYARLLNLAPEDLLDKPIFSVVPNAEAHYRPQLERVLKTGEMLQIYDSPYSLIIKGKLIEGYVHYTYQPYRDKHGEILGVMAIIQDVTETVLARKKIEESEKQFSTLANNIQNLAWMANADGGIYWYNNRWYEYTGTTPAEMEGWGWKSVHDPEQLPLVMDRWQQSINTGEPFEMIFPLKGADNKFRSFLTRIEPMRNEDGKVKRWVGTNTDITEQKETEALLGYRKALLEAHNESSIDGILLVDAKGKILSYNLRFIEIWNMPQSIVNANDDDAALAFAITQLVHPKQFIDKVKSLYEHPQETSLDELEFKDGKIVERNGYSVIGEDGTYYAWSWTFRDITKQKKYEKTIIESEQRFRTLAETLPQLIWITDEKGTYEYTSNQWMNYSGLDPYTEDIWEKLVHAQDIENLTHVWTSSLQTGKTYQAEARLKNKAGAYRWHLVQGEPIKNEKGSIIKWIGAFTDIEIFKEEQKQKDDFLTMASHELRTPVTTIKACCQIIERILEKNGDVQIMGMMKTMSKQVNRLTRLIADLLDVTKMQKGGLMRNASVFNLDDLVKEAIDDLQKTIVTHQIMDNLNADLSISGDKDKLSQVLNNLLSNAAKYSPGADKIIVSTRRVEDGIQLGVQDFGIGISTNVQQRVFEQFYRVTGENQSTFQGMGIGLYICAEIIKREGGRIWVESTTGKGSVFYVWLPVDHANSFSNIT